MGVLTLSLVVVEDEEHAVSSSGSGRKDGRPASMGTSVWQRLPQELVETVLLFLPPSSQARFRSVCKRWRKLIKSATFQEESSNLRNDCLLCFVQPPGFKSPLCLPGDLIVKSLKVHRLHVDMPGLMIPSNSHHVFKREVFSHGSLVVVGSWNWRSRRRVQVAIRCWVLDIANPSWLELPPVVLRRGDLAGWNAWVAGSDTNNFQVSLMIKMYAPRSDTLHTYSATSTTWTTVDIPWPQEASPTGVTVEPAWCALSKLGYILVLGYGRVRVWLWEGTSNASPPKFTPLPSERTIRILSHPDTDAVFGVSSYGSSCRFKLFRLDGSSGEWKWMCVVSGLPQGCVLDDDKGFKISRAKLVGNEVLVEVWLRSVGFSSFRGCLFLTYHILTGCYEWLSALSKQEFETDSKSTSASWAELGLMDATAFMKL